MAKLGESQLTELVARRAAGETIQALAKAFQCSVATIHKHVTKPPAASREGNDRRAFEAISVLLERLSRDGDARASDVSGALRIWQELRGELAGASDAFDPSRLTPTMLQVAAVLSEIGHSGKAPLDRAEMTALVRNWLDELEAA